MKTDKIWNIPASKVLNTTHLVRRFFIDEKLPVGWPVKWGGKYDLPINGKLIPTGLTCLIWSGDEWKNFIRKSIIRLYEVKKAHEIH